jgi:hypothetical protein
MQMAGCNECGQGGATNANGNECGCATNAAVQRMRWRVQRMRTGATNAAVQRMRTGATNAAVQRMRTGCNECGRRVQRMRQLMRRRRRVQRMRTATNAQNGMQRMRMRDERDYGSNECSIGGANCASGRGVWVTRIRSGGEGSARRGS